MQRLPRALLAALVLTVATSAGATEGKPWRLAEAAGLPAWLSISGTHRTRYETLDGQFRAGRGGGDQMVALRTTVLGELRFDRLKFVGELMDSRAMLDDSGTPISTTMVNPAELLQAYASWTDHGLFGENAASEFRVGRLTMDVGSRRLVARNRYRNTINAFTGIEWRWTGQDGRQLQVFYTLPVNRKPNTAADLLDNKIEFDEEDTDVRFWGIYYAFPKLPWEGNGEIYLLGLYESDSSGRPTRDRELYTPGIRLYRPPEKGRFDYLIESVFQFGESRSSTAATNTRDLDHFAYFQHAEVGYTFARPWSPQILAQYDYASGDDDPTDGDNERFDTLFGARRFDFGPTGIYGPFARSNLSSPGVRLKLKPSQQIQAFIAYRGYWLASDQDAWTTSGVRDAAGASGSFIGHQVEASVRWDVLPGNYSFEAGVAHLFAGDFMDDAPNTNGQGDATYLYSQVSFSF